MNKINDAPLPRTSSKPLIVISRIASFVFHPLFMTLFGAVICKVASDTFVTGDFKKWVNELFALYDSFALCLNSIIEVVGIDFKRQDA